ncbi:MAG: hypothetical protein PHQ40_09715, partial [Anaerolineaceae bacterium]|nr:hypothetical protein [Anaerolineaceae bacterium]
TIVYQFPAIGDCQVNLTVDNAYDSSAAAPQTISVSKAAPSLTTNPSSGGAAPVTLHASATLSSAYNPTGSILFNLFSPEDVTCSGTPAYSETRPISGTSASTTSGYLADIVGTWHWTASYAGDANNNSAASSCSSGSITVDPPLKYIYLPVTIR